MDHFPETPFIVMRRVKPTRLSNNSNLSRSCNSLVMNCFFDIYLQSRRIVSHPQIFLVDMIPLDYVHSCILIKVWRVGEALCVDTEFYALNTAPVEFTNGVRAVIPCFGSQ